MSEAKHTPGPWELDTTLINGVDYGFSGVRTVSEDGYEFPRHSFTRTVCELPHNLRTDDPEPRANMTLIAAAPDLLESLKACIDRVVVGPNHNAIHPSKMFCTHCGIDSEIAVHHPACTILAAELAIAKAEGRS